MAAALGFALSQPRRRPWRTAALDWLALPYLVLSMTPVLQRLMPRPARGWTAAQFSPSDVRLGGLDDLVADPADRADGDLCAGRHILIAFAIWLLRLAACVVGHLGAPDWRPSPFCCLPRRSSSRMVRHRRLGIRGSAGVNFDGWERFTRALNQAVAQGKPVFVDFTARGA